MKPCATVHGLIGLHPRILGPALHIASRIAPRRMALNLGVLGFFKYFNFFVDSAEASLAWIGDSLMVLDPRSGRMSFLSRTGAWIGQLPG